MDKKNLISNLKGIGSNIQDQLNNKADIDHTHDDLVGAPIGHTHTKSEITDFPSSMPANGGNADTANVLKIVDTRKTNQNPIWYYTNKANTITYELKELEVIGISNGGASLCTLETKTPSTNQSDGKITQKVFIDNEISMFRYSNGNDSWGEWQTYNESATRKEFGYVAGNTTEISITSGEVETRQMKCIYHFKPKYNGYIRIVGEFQAKTSSWIYFGFLGESKDKIYLPYIGKTANPIPVGGEVPSDHLRVNGFSLSSTTFQKREITFYVKKGTVAYIVMSSASDGIVACKNVKICYDIIEMENK